MIHYNKLGRNARKALAGLLVAANVAGGLPVYAAEPADISNPDAVETVDAGDAEQGAVTSVTEDTGISADDETKNDDASADEDGAVNDAEDNDVSADGEDVSADGAEGEDTPVDGAEGEDTPADDAEGEDTPADDAEDGVTDDEESNDTAEDDSTSADDTEDEDAAPVDDTESGDDASEDNEASEADPVEDAVQDEETPADTVVIPEEVTVENEILKADEDGWHEVGDSIWYIESGEIVTSSWKQRGAYWYYLDSDGYAYTGDVTTPRWIDKDIDGNYNGAYYRFDRSGILMIGWYRSPYSEGDMYYSMKDGKVAEGVLEIDGNTYYFEQGLRLRNCSYSDEDAIYYFGEDGKLTEKISLGKDGWQETSDGNWMYIEDGKLVQSCWKEIKGVRYYFTSDGFMCRDTVEHIWDSTAGKGGYYRFDANGKVVTGWYQDEYERWYYYGSDGMAPQGMQKVGNATYYFQYDGRMTTDYTYQQDSKLYYFGEDGKLTDDVSLAGTGWKGTADGSWYYTKDGELVKDDWLQVGKFWYRFGYDGKMYKNTTWNGYDQETGKYTLYRFDQDGHMVTGWYQDRNGSWYYYDGSGAAAQGIVKVGKDTYYFSYGRMQTKTSFSDDKYLYSFDEDGKLTDKISIEKDGWKKNKEGDWFYAESGKIVKNEWRQISGSRYFFGYDGAMYKDGRHSVYDSDTGVYAEYCFDKDGRMVTGWYQSYGTWYYYGKDGKPVSGLQTISKKTYYFSGDGEMLVNGQAYVDGVLYVYGSNGVCSTGLKNGWLQDTYYVEKGKAVTKWKQISGKWYYFDPESGRKTVNATIEIEGALYSFDSEGVMKKGWIKAVDQGELYWMYANGSGALTADTWKQLGGKWYYFDSYYKMVTGLKEIDGKLEKFNASGLWTGTASNNAWYQDAAGDWFYIQDKEILKSTTEQINGKYYHFDADGRMSVKTFYGDYYFGSNGAAVKNQWRLDARGLWHYYGDDSKAVRSGWKKIGSSWYYFVSGTIVTEDRVIDGKLYHFQKNGVSDKKEVKISDGWNLIDGQYYYYKNGSYLTGLQKIGNARYYFDSEDGQMAYQSSVGSYSSGYYFADKNGKLISKAWGKDADGNYYYAGADGKLVKGLQTIGGKKYLFNEFSGRMYDYDIVLSDDVKTLYAIDPSGAVTSTVKAGKNGWTKTANGNWFYVNGGEFVRGYQTIGGKAYYFYSTGMAANVVVDGYGYADTNGVLHLDGWYGEGSLIYVRNGRILSGPGTVSKKNYYFSYIADTGLHFADGNYYYFDGSKGTRKVYNLKEGWNKVNGLWYYAVDGALQTGSREIGGKYYQFTDEGIMLSDCLYSGRNGYQYLDKNGLPVKNSWKKVSSLNVYHSSSVYDYDEEDIEESWYYFDANGFALTGKHVINGKTYIFAENGKML